MPVVRSAWMYLHTVDNLELTTARIPNSVNHYPSDVGYSHSSEGDARCQVTRGGETHAGLNYCPRQQWHWGQTHYTQSHVRSDVWWEVSG